MHEQVIDESQLEKLIPHFYGLIRRDELLGPLFNAAIGDWPGHMEKLIAFWSSVMLTSGRYKGREEEVAARIVNKQRAQYGEQPLHAERRKPGGDGKLPPVGDTVDVAPAVDISFKIAPM